MKEIYAIYYDNGESWGDRWIGIAENHGFYAKREDAEDKIKQLQIEHDFRIEEEIAEGYISPPFENEKWEVKPVNYFE